MTPPRAVIFDLDGTLVDSLADIGAALTQALAEHALPAPSDAALRDMVGAGARVLVERAVAGRADVDAVLARFGAAYRARPLAATRVYPGLGAALDELAARGLIFGLLSNKPDDLTQVIAAALLDAWPFATIYGHRPGLPLKPDPTSARCVADELGVPPEACAFVGDSAIDVATARAAGMRAIGVAWGFRGDRELAGADQIATTPADLVRAITTATTGP